MMATAKTTYAVDDRETFKRLLFNDETVTCTCGSRWIVYIGTYPRIKDERKQLAGVCYSCGTRYRMTLRATGGNLCIG